MKDKNINECLALMVQIFLTFGGRFVDIKLLNLVALDNTVIVFSFEFDVINCNGVELLTDDDNKGLFFCWVDAMDKFLSLIHI